MGILYTALLLAALVFDDRKHDPTFAAAMTWVRSTATNLVGLEISTDVLVLP